MMRHLPLLLLLSGTQAHATTAPRVPTRMTFADIRLHISPAARARIQEKVDSLTQSPKHFQELLDAVNLFMPIVERILTQESIPADFKYQVIQESAMVSDALHASQTVGFWQFKAHTAQEVGLKINAQVDERKHIIAATKGAAQYLKKNNEYLDNWLYTLLAYNRGRGYVEANLDYKKQHGAKRMKIKADTHWYIIHLLAHKLVFQHQIGRTPHPTLYLHEYEEAHGKSLHEIAQEFSIDSQQLKDYNKWLKLASVPHDTHHATIIPLTHQQYAQHHKTKSSTTTDRRLDYAQYWERAHEFPTIVTRKNKKTGTTTTEINGIPGIQAQEGDTTATLAQAGKLTLARFLAYNELAADHEVIPHQAYYYKPKYSRANIHIHIVRPGETWWSIAQKYGITKAALLLKNRLRKEVPLKPGRVLWLRFIRPAKVPIAYEYR